MADDTSIFAVPFDAAGKLIPSQEQLEAFLRSPKKEGGRERHADDCEPYRQLLLDIDRCEDEFTANGGLADIGAMIRFSVAGHTGIASEELLAVVEQFKFHLQALHDVDYQTPASFIKTAEKEMSRLDARNLKHALRLARLSEMIRDRKALLDAAKGRWSEIATELRRMAIYIRENLVKVEKKSEAAVAVLKTIDYTARERQVAENTKIYIKDRVKGSLKTGSITQADLNAAKKEYDSLFALLSRQVDEDGKGLRTVLQSVCNQARQAEIDIALHLADMDARKSAKDKQDCLKRIELAMTTLLRDMQLQPRLTADRAESVHAAYCAAERDKMLISLLEEIGTDRRLRADRRRSRDRRKGPSASYKGPERRSGRDRRAERERRR